MKLLEFQFAQNPMLTILKWMTDQLIELEIALKCNAPKVVHVQARTAYRSAYRTCSFDTEHKRSEQALIEVAKEAWVSGVSTRKIESLAKKIGIEHITASQVSNITSEVDKQAEEFRSRPLDEEYPLLWVALYEKIRDNGKVISVAVMVVRAVNMQGNVRIIAVEPMHNESKATYTALFEQLKECWLEKVWLGTVCDHREMLSRCCMAAVQGALHAHHSGPYTGKGKDGFAKQLKLVWKQKDAIHALACAQELEEEYGQRFPTSIECLMEGLENSLQFYNFYELDFKKITSNNGIEGLNAEIRRKSRLVGVFPSTASYMRLLVCYLMEYQHDYESGRAYLSSESIPAQRQLNDAKVA